MTDDPRAACFQKIILALAETLVSIFFATLLVFSSSGALSERFNLKTTVLHVVDLVLPLEA